jgi:hypothetical protein
MPAILLGEGGQRAWETGSTFVGSFLAVKSRAMDAL